MNLVHPTSLVSTLDSAAGEFFGHRPISPAVLKELSSLLVSRQIISGPNSGFFISFTSESWTHMRLFTGETLHTEFACRHITLIEAARLLVLLSDGQGPVNKSIDLANQRMASMCYTRFCSKGECKPLTIAYMRYLAAGPSGEAPPQLQALLARLASYRDGKGKWQGFPFFFTLLMLTEVQDPLASQELDYASRSIVKQPPLGETKSPYAERRRSILNTIRTRSAYDAHPLLLGQYR
jgi:hypothetical protein